MQSVLGGVRIAMPYDVGDDKEKTLKVNILKGLSGFLATLSKGRASRSFGD